MTFVQLILGESTLGAIAKPPRDQLNMVGHTTPSADQARAPIAPNC